MKLMINKYNTVAKAIAIVSGFVCIINAIIVLFTKTLIPGLGPLSLGTFLLALAILELNNYEKTNDKLSQVLGITYIILVAVNLYMGIVQVDNFIN